jgi:hypothetical protein
MNKAVLLSIIFFAGLVSIDAQRLPGLDKSPLDAAIYRTERNSPAIAKIVYSRPFANDRTVWGGLIPYDKVWRTGANEAPEITFYQDVTFGGKAIKAGTYCLFTLATADNVTFILNEELNQWGTYGYNDSKDIVRVPAAVVEKTADHVENFTITFDNQSDGSTHLVVAWADKQARLPLK